MSDVSHDAASHYDRVTDAWTLLLGDDLHYGLFPTGEEDLATATRELTLAMLDAAAVTPGSEVLDVGCGTGAPACFLAAENGARVTGISTSAVGVGAACQRAVAAGVDGLVAFEVRDGTDNGFPDGSFDRVWVLESSHLMRRKDRLVAECARVLRSGGRMTLCDIVLRRSMPFEEVRRLREPLALLREVFGDAHMEPLTKYAELVADHGLVVDDQIDLTAATRPTFSRWRENAVRYRDEVEAFVGSEGRSRFVESCDVLEGFWDDGTLGYGLISAIKR